MIYKKPVLIAEIGCNHKGDVGIAKKMIKTAKDFCGVSFVKFQKRTPKDLLTSEEYNRPHPHPENSYGSTYGEHREYLEFNRDQLRELKEYSESIGVACSASVWDVVAAKDIVSLSPKFIKIPSACNLDFKMLDYICENFEGDIHLSFGMTTYKEEEKIIEFFVNKNKNKNLIIYSCVSGYPVPDKDTHLLEIKRLKDKFGDTVKDIGFSGHHIGFAVDIAAYTLGANFIERHYTLNRTWKGTDHAASLEPDGLRRLCRNLSVVHSALKYKNKEVLDIEEEQRKKLKRL